METSGFYKVDNGDLMYAPNFVSAPGYELNRNDLQNYTLPIEGWYWFDSIEEANAFFNIAAPVNITEIQNTQNDILTILNERRML